jgi:hypothetical protein
VAALLPAVRERVFPGTYGLTVESFLPLQLRDTPVRIDHSLPRQEIRVIPIPATGPITGVEMRVGPGTHPIDVGLHAGEINRVRRWTGRLGDARLALAKFGERLKLKPVTPEDRARFEAAGEVGKLGPIIEERIRRGLATSDPTAAAAHHAQVLRLLAQQERARRILTGELVAEPRGYVAQEGEPESGAKQPETGPPDAARELRAQREAEAKRALARPGIEGKAAAVDKDLQKLRDNLMNDLQDLAEQNPQYEELTHLDLDNEADRMKLRRELETWPQPPPATEGAKPPAGPVLRRDVVQRWRALLQAELKAPDRLREAEDALAVLRAEEAAAALAVQHWSGMMKKQAGVPVSPKLPEPWAGWGWEPELLATGTTAQKESHLNGYRTELNLANHVAEGLGHAVLKHGAPNFGEGRRGSDVISVDLSPEGAGDVFLWDGKYLGSGKPHRGSTTFVGGPLAEALAEATRVIGASTTLPAEVRAKALANLEAGRFTTFTVSSDDTVNFHSGVKKEFVTKGEVPKETKVPPPWKTGK